VASVLDRLFDFAVHEKNPATLERLVRLVRTFRARDDLPVTATLFCDKALARLADPVLLASFLDQIAEGDAATDAAIAFATAMGPAAVDPLVKTLHRIEGQAVHRKICDALIAVAGGSLGAVLDRFDVDHPDVAVDAVYVAKAMRSPNLTPRLRELVFYPDPRVKLEMIGLVAARDDADATELLLASLNDLDKRVRLRVLDAVGHRNEAKVRERLSELAFGKDLAERAADEQEAIFRALGQVGDEHTVDQLRSLLEKRKLIHIGKGNDSKLLAIKALERLRQPGALDVLTRLCEDGNEAVRLRAQRAKDHLAGALAERAAKTERQP
jgi:HEAT repeat protein